MEWPKFLGTWIWCRDRANCRQNDELSTTESTAGTEPARCSTGFYSLLLTWLPRCWYSPLSIRHLPSGTLISVTQVEHVEHNSAKSDDGNSIMLSFTLQPYIQESPEMWSVASRPTHYRDMQTRFGDFKTDDRYRLGTVVAASGKKRVRQIRLITSQQLQITNSRRTGAYWCKPQLDGNTSYFPAPDSGIVPCWVFEFSWRHTHNVTNIVIIGYGQIANGQHLRNGVTWFGKVAPPKFCRKDRESISNQRRTWIPRGHRTTWSYSR